jgi:hypothetical protein
MRTLTWAALAAAILAPALAAPAFAQRDRGHDRGDRWQGDIHRFHDRDFDRWRGGSWFHGAHDGRDGWWWRVGPLWYFYATPIYPYPDPYVPPIIAVPPPAPTWYYCANPRGYYPYVGRCFMPWRAVPAR